MSWVVEERPSRIVGVVVPLPLQSESRFREGIVRRQIGLWIGLAHIWLGVWLACGSHIRSVVAQHWPTVHPFHWLKIRDTSHGASVLEENRPPLAHLCLNQSTLVNLLVFEHAVAAFLVRSERTLGAENGLRTLGAAVGSINVIVVTDVVEVGTLATIAHADDALAFNFLESGCIELAHGDVANACCHVEIAIAILLTVFAQSVQVVAVVVEEEA